MEAVMTDHVFITYYSWFYLLFLGLTMIGQS